MKVIQEQLSELEVLEEEQKKKAKELEEKDKLIKDYSKEIAQLVAELDSTKKVSEQRNHSIQRLRRENRKLRKETQENTKMLARIEEKANDTLIEKKQIENSSTLTHLRAFYEHRGEASARKPPGLPVPEARRGAEEAQGQGEGAVRAREATKVPGQHKEHEAGRVESLRSHCNSHKQRIPKGRKCEVNGR